MDIADIHKCIQSLIEKDLPIRDIIFKMTEAEFQRYAENIPAKSAAKVWQDLASCGRSEVTLLGVKVVVEG